jgi:Cohesin domain
MKKNNYILILALFILVVFYMVSRSGDKINPSLTSATLSISPTAKTVKVGETFTLDVVLDTAGADVDGLDFILNQNPRLLEVVKVAPVDILGSTVYNQTDAKTGRISASQVSGGGSSYRGGGTIATITFLAKGSGTANITFDFTVGATNDSNVASLGVDILSSVTNGSVVISN